MLSAEKQNKAAFQIMIEQASSAEEGNRNRIMGMPEASTFTDCSPLFDTMRGKDFPSVSSFANNRISGVATSLLQKKSEISRFLKGTPAACRGTSSLKNKNTDSRNHQSAMTGGKAVGGGATVTLLNMDIIDIADE